jgi:hypothetical protein
MFVYLAGAMENAPGRGCGWRAEIKPFLSDTLGHRVFDPCIEENRILSLNERRKLGVSKTSDLAEFRRLMRKIIDADLNTILEEIDYIICLWDEHVTKGGGTHGELTLAYHNNIPVYMVTRIPPAQISSWILGCTTEVFTSFDALRSFLRNRYSG